MFYSDALLTKKGSLAKIWLAAHMESRLTKNQITLVDVEQSVKDILKGDQEPMALRVSGQLLLGVCRIYSRKAKYLLDDCNDALVTIKMQIRPALVDLPEHRLRAANHDINIDNNELNLDWDIDFAPYVPPGDFGGLGGDMTYDDIYAPFDPLRRDIGPSDGIQSQYFGLDLGLDIGMHDDDNEGTMDMDETLSAIEVGRDAAGARRHVRESIGSGFGAGRLSAVGDLSMGQGDISMGADMGMEFEPQMDLGLDIGMDIDDAAGRFADDIGMGGMGMDIDEDLMAGVPGLSPPGEEKKSQESSRLSTPPAESTSVNDSSVANLSPKTAAQIDALALKQQSAAALAAQKKKRFARVIVDETTELESERANARHRDLSSILAPQRFIPSSTSVIRLLEIRHDPMAHYFPMHQSVGGHQLMYAGPKGFGPELASMFMFPSSILSKRRGGDENAEEEEEVDTAIEQRKRARTGDSEDVEVGRRESRALSLGLGSARGGDDTFDQGGFGGGEDVFGPIDDAPFNFDDNNDTNLNLDDLDPADDRLAPLEFHADGTPKPRKLRAPRRRKIVRKNVDGEEEEFSELEDDIEEEEDKERARVGRLSSRLGSARPSDGGGVYDNFGPEMGTDVYDPVFADLETQSSHGDGGPLDVFDVRPSSLASGSDAAVAGQHRSQRAGSHRSASVRAGSVRASSVARSMIGADEEDLEPTMTQQRTGSASNLQSGISKNTARALTILRRELAVGPREEDSSQHAAAAEEEEEEKEVEQVEKVLSFETISTTKKTTRRAASAFFFELLVLGTKDALKLDQTQPYADIQVRAKDKLWRQDRGGINVPSVGGGGVTA